MYRQFKQFVYRLLIPFIRIYKYLDWRFYLLTADEINLVVGAGPTKYEGWFSTDIVTLDVTKEFDFKKYFVKKRINKVLAEHILEHLTNPELDLMAENLFKYSEENVNIRIAVPDGFHSDKEYINIVKPGGTGEGAADHKNLFTVISLSEIFERSGFKSHPVEYWDKDGKFHQGYKNDENGFVIRSFVNDKRNVGGNPVYTSLIIDFKKQ
jgi:predicted SAM-dependent methyltransferase